MRVRDKQIAVSPELHYKVGVVAALKGITLKEFTEAALRTALVGNGDERRLVDRLLVDSGVEYEAK